jgi:undecaprenyl-diphosphatase
MSAANWFGAHWWWLVIFGNGVALVIGLGVWLLVQRIDERHVHLSLGGVLVTALAFIALALALNSDTALPQFDTALTAALSRSLSIDALQFWLPVTHLGDGITRTLLGIGVAAVLYRRRRALAVTWLLALIGGGLLNRSLKAWFERVRPTRDHDLIVELSWSFPSGHASGAMVTYGMLGFILLRVTPPKWHAAIVALAMIVVANIGLSRVLLQVHFFSDVLAGFALGAAWLAACIGALLWFERRPALAKYVD